MAPRPPIIRANGPETRAQFLARVSANIASGAQSFDDIRFLFGGAASGANAGAAVNDAAIIAQGPEAISARLDSILTNRGATPWITDPDPTTPQPTEEETAFAFGARILESYGLGDLTQWWKDMLIAGHTDDWIALELRNQPAFRSRFAAIFRRQEAGLTPMSPEDVINYEGATRQLMRAAGLPPGFYDSHEDFVELLANDVSYNEVTDRINDGYLKVTTQGPEVRDVFASLFGPSGDAALAAMFIDPTKALPTLQRQVAAAEFGGAGLRFGFTLNSDTALRGADLGAASRAAQGFAALSDMRGLFDESLSESQDLRAEREGVSAIFDFGDTTSRDAVTSRKSQRTAAFAGQSGVSTTRSGVAGFGKAD